ncbi:uncharacterized protein LOC118437545 [Folsomia candida]|uniref:Uncharacterized protein n=1 Tax=Folsomia candida TaxID=158441 RepID=A0A226DP92_FOLCA|nr:uncharacterized protein LOC118437545 [Folsomia candida]OXA47029.1 hypothetical protein Fcan01_18075 [Folsomia candida]
MSWNRVAIVILLIQRFEPSNADCKVPCPLQWVKYNSETTNFTSDKLVFSYGETQIISRAKGADGKYHAGYFDILLQSAYIPISPYAFADVELLNNQHNCTIGWSFPGDNNDKIRVSVDRERNGTTFIGRSTSSFFSFLPGYIPFVSVGEVEDGELKFIRSPANLNVEVSPIYNFLTSTSQGLNLHLKDFNFTSDPNVGNFRVMNVESIDNFADCIVSQVVTHSKVVTTTHSLSEFGSSSKSWGISASVTYTFGSKNVGASGSISGGYSEENTDRWSETLATSKESRITISKNITVGPQESILACSAIKISDNFQSDYVAKAEYSAPGLKGWEVANILDCYGFMNISVNENSAWFYTEGSYQGSSSISTHFHVSPKDSNINCRNLKEFGISESRL